MMRAKALVMYASAHDYLILTKCPTRVLWLSFGCIKGLAFRCWAATS